MLSENHSQNDLRTPARNYKLDAQHNMTSLNKECNELSRTTNENSFEKLHRLKMENVVTSPFELSSPELRDYGPNKSSKTVFDRFIPVRKNNKISLAFSDVLDDESQKENQSADNESANMLNIPKYDKDENNSNTLNNYLKTHILGQQGNQQRVPEESKDSIGQNILSFQYQLEERDNLKCLVPQTLKSPNSQINKGFRKISKVPFKVQDAPAQQDDFYLNLLDWSESNLQSVGLSACVYLWSASNGKVFKVCDLGAEDMVTSVNWSKTGNLLGIGSNSGEVHIWDINKVKKIRTMDGHTGRVGTLAWGNNCLVSGSRDKTILLRDIRSNNNYHEKLLAHKQEVCGIKWSYDDQMFCSGGNDNKLFVWTPHAINPIFKSSQHKAAVKALAWSPHQHGLLASGGCTADRCIRFWNAHLGKLVSTIDTGSQVCNLLFSKNMNELVSTHGYTHNQIHLWNYPKMKKMATLTGHTFRVLYLAMNPDGKTIVTGAGDETLRFWNLFPGDKKDDQKQNFFKGNLTQLKNHIR